MSYATLPVAAANALDAGASLWALLGALVVAMLALDLLVFARHAAPSLRSSAAWSVGWLAVALGFGAALWAGKGGDAGAQYLAGYLLERSLSLDNVFVFAVILGYFAVPRPVQAKVLSWGIMLALVLRLVFILLGAALLDAAHVTFYAFGALLLYTAWKLARHDGEEIEPERNPALRALRRLVPMSRDYHGDRLVVRAGGGRMATPPLAGVGGRAATRVGFPGDAAAGGVRRRRDDRRRLRGRLGAGDLRHHAGAVRRLRGECVRDARPARAVLPARGDDGPLRPPRARPRRHPRLHRRQDAPHRRLAPADLGLARRHRGRPRGDRGALAPRVRPRPRWGLAGAADGDPTPWRRARFPRTIRGMTRMSRDLGLQVRMLLTMFLLGLLYVALVAALLAAGTGTATMLLVVAGLALAQLTLSDKMALRSIGAREVSPSDAPGLHAIVERLCVQADLPKPRIAIAPTAVPNAFALGRSPRRAVVCATTGLLDLLEPHELEAVMAHELAHVRHRDVLIMTVASFFASIAAMVLQFGVLFGGGRDRDSGPAFVVVLLVSAVVYAVSFVLMLALSRYREFVADRGAAVVTGRPSALASALVKLSDGMQRVPQRDLRAAGELNAFFIVPARATGTLRALFSTHPPVEQRLAALARLEADLQRPLPT